MGNGRHVRKRTRRSGSGSDAHLHLRRSAATVVVLGSAAGFALLTGHDSYSAQQPHSSTSIAVVTTTTSTTSSTSVVTTTTTPPTSTLPSRIEDPFHSASLAAYLATRSDNVTAALYDVSTHRTYIYRPDVDEITASMEKMDILAVLLWEHQSSHTALSAHEETLATKMMEYSN